ncbi:MAG: glycosyltransferase [Candidatus Dormiibacterota bacterium]
MTQNQHHDRADEEFTRIPIFVITYDRITVLQRAIRSYESCLQDKVEVIFHDNGSTYPPMLNFLDEVESAGATVFRTGRRVRRPQDLNSVADSVSSWMARHPKVNHYIVTDPDVELLGPCPDLIELYKHLLDSFNVDVVGPMLRIDDLPDAYPLKAEVIRRHTDQFWHKTPEHLVWRNRLVEYQHAAIDSTFGFYRGGYRFHRLTEGLRTYQPYWARHLDWYLDPEQLAPDQAYYLAHASDVAHWSGKWLKNALTSKPTTGRWRRILKSARVRLR